MKLPILNELKYTGKNVFVRLDTDIAIENGQIKEFARVESSLPTLFDLLSKANKLILAGHRDRPGGHYNQDLSLQPLVDYYAKELNTKIEFIPFIPYLEEFKSSFYQQVDGSSSEVFLLENLRFWTGENDNNSDFIDVLSGISDCFVNEAFASSHRSTASIVGVAQKIENKAVGKRFEIEINNLNKILEEPQRPVVGILSGVKEDKLKYLDGFSQFCDTVLVAGRLPAYLEDKAVPKNVVVARLIADKEDITVNSVEVFEQHLKKAGTIVVGGPVGKFEDEGHLLGTQRVFDAVANSKAFTVAGGGDTVHALNKLGLQKKLNWVSIGGGAMLEYLTTKTLPGIEALI